MSATRPACAVSGCPRPVHYSRLCSAHAERKRRSPTGDPGGPEPRRRPDHAGTGTPQGWAAYAPTHPLADSSGHVPAGRALLYEQTGGEPPTCTDCNAGPLPWARVYVVRTEEGPVPCCASCRSRRASAARGSR